MTMTADPLSLNKLIRTIAADEIRPLADDFGDGTVATVEGSFAAVRKGDPLAVPTPGFFVPPRLTLQSGDHVWYHDSGGFKLVVEVLNRDARATLQSLWINVMDHGAKGDGVTDDTDAIKAAVTEAISTGVGVVFFPRGTYLVSSTIYLATEGLSFVGAGRGATIIKAATFINNITVAAANVSFRDMSINKIADGTGGTAITSTAAGTVIVDCLFYSNRVDLLGSGGRIENCWFEAFPNRAIVMAGTGSHHAENNTITSGMQYLTDVGGAIEISADSCKVTNGSVRDIASNHPAGFPVGIYINNADHFVVTGVRVDAVHCGGPNGLDAGQAILLYGDSKFGTVANNPITGTESEGITLFDGPAWNSIDANTISGCRKNQIELYDVGGGNSVTDNIANASELQYGIQLYGDGASTSGTAGYWGYWTVITGNTTKGNFKAGIGVVDSRFVSVTVNQAQDNNRGDAAYSGIYVRNSTDVIVDANNATDTAASGKLQSHGLKMQNASSVQLGINNFGGNAVGEIFGYDQIKLDPERNGTTFPATPVTGFRKFRTDRQIEYVYDGTRWLSDQRSDPMPTTAGVQPWTATITGAERMAANFAAVYDLWLVEFQLTFFVQSGGSALDASNKWVATLRNAPTGAILATVNIDSGASAAWRSAVVPIGALLGTTQLALSTTHTKTGAPGNLFALPRIVYRLVG